MGKEKLQYGHWYTDKQPEDFEELIDHNTYDDSQTRMVWTSEDDSDWRFRYSDGTWRWHKYAAHTAWMAIKPYKEE